MTLYSILAPPSAAKTPVSLTLNFLEHLFRRVAAQSQGIELFSLRPPDILGIPAGWTTVRMHHGYAKSDEARLLRKKFWAEQSLSSVVMRTQNHNRWYESVFSRVFKCQNRAGLVVPLSAGGRISAP